MGIFTKYDVFLWKIKRIISFLMKHLLTLILSVLLLTACGESGRNSQLLNRTEAVMDDSCEVALSILRDSIDSSTLTTERGRAIYAVLLSQALDKNYIDIASDSIIAPAVAYFADGNDPHYAMLTHYYYGKTLLNQNKLSDAIVSCTKAADFANEQNNDFYLGLIYGTIAKAYSLTHNHNESIKFSKSSYLHFSKINKQPHKKYAYFSLAIAHNNNKDFYQSKSIHKELIDSATLNCDTAFLVEVLDSYSHLLWNNQKIIESKQILKKLQNNYKYRLSATSLAHLADIYTKENNQDSASYYLFLAKTNASCLKDSIAIMLADYNYTLANEDYIEAIKLQEEHIDALNTSTEDIWKQSVMTLQRDYFESQAKNANLEVESKKNQIILIVIISVAILFIAIFIIYALRMKNKAQKEKINRILNEHYQSKNLISNAENRIIELEDLLANETDKSQNLINELAIQQDALKLFTQQSKLHEEATNTIESSEIVIQFRKRLSEDSNPTINDWNQLDKYINQLFPGFKNVLYNLAKLSDIEYQVCLLLKSKFTPTEIAKLIIISKSGMSNIRKRLFVKAFKTDGSASDWDKFIASL